MNDCFEATLFDELTPLYPVLPVIAGLLSVYFIWMLPKTTKIMVGIWLIVGIIVYATYGIKHSKLQN